MCRVLDFTRLLPGPFCSRILADLGAEVIRIEQPGRGDWVRYLPPLDPQRGDGLLYQALNRGKKSLALNLKSAEGQAIMLRLIQGADVLLESFRPGVMERLGLGYESLARSNPRLIYCSLSGYGPAGPYRDRAGHDLNYIGLAGLLDLTGPREGPPYIPGAQVADLAGALWAAIGILVALLDRERTGGGKRVGASLLGGALSLLPLAVTRYQGEQPIQRGDGLLIGGVVCYQVYETLDGEHMTLGALEPEFWSAFCQAVARDDLIGQQFAPAVRGEPAYDELCDLFRGRTRQEWTEAVAGIDGCCEPVYTVEEALASPAVKALGMLTSRGLLPPVSFSDRESPLAASAPSLGQHTVPLLADLGYLQAEIDELRDQGVV